jgi:hypothetical protein
MPSVLVHLRDLVSIHVSVRPSVIVHMDNEHVNHLKMYMNVYLYEN